MTNLSESGAPIYFLKKLFLELNTSLAIRKKINVLNEKQKKQHSFKNPIIFN